MKNFIRSLGGFCVAGVFSACMPTASDYSVCRTAGLFGTQAECHSATQDACQMSQLQSSSGSKSVICWKSSTALNGTTGSSTTVTSTTGSSSTSTSGTSTTTSTTGPVIVDYLYTNLHVDADCSGSGGSVITLDSTKRVCKLPLSSCPGGWSAFKSAAGVAYTQTENTLYHEAGSAGGVTKVLYGHLSLVATPVESVVYCSNWGTFSGCKGYSTQYANVKYVACY